MATIIRIKRSTGTSAPGSLKSGELAYSSGTGTQSNGGDRLYFGKGDDGSGNATTVEVIGGAYFSNLLDHVAGTLTASSAIIVDASSKIDNLKVDNLDLNGNTISSTNTDGNIVLDPNGAGTVDVNTSKIVNVTDPTANQDAATKKYVDDQNAAGQLDLSTDSGGTHSLMLQDSDLTIVGGTGIGTRLDRHQITVELDNTSVTAGSYGSATAIPAITVDAQGRITAASTNNVATDLTVAGDAGTNQTISLLSDTLTIAGGTNINTVASGGDTLTIHLDSSVDINTQLTVDNIKINGNTISSTDGSNQLFIDPAPEDSDGGDLIIRGNLQVNGTTTTINSVNLSVNDKLITLADSAADSAAADGAGIEVAGANASILYDHATTRWDFNRDIEAANFHGNVTGNITGNVTGNITGNVTGNIDGDSGDLRTFTANTVTTGSLTTDSASILGDLRITGNFVDATTDNLNEGSSNLYFTDERVDDRLNNLLLAGEGIDLTYNDVANSLTIDGEDATLTNKGIASFGGYADSANAPAPGNARQFSISSGDVTIAVIDGGTY